MTVPSNIAKFTIPGDDDYSPDQADLQKLAALLEKYAPHDGRFDLVVGDLRVIRASKTTQEATHTMAQPGICIVAQGAKSVSLAQDAYEYDESRMVVYAAEVPVNAKIVKASKDEPYLCLVVNIDPHKLTDLILKVFPNGASRSASSCCSFKRH